MIKRKGLVEARNAMKYLKRLNKHWIKMQKCIRRGMPPASLDVKEVYENLDKASREFIKLDEKLRKRTKQLLK